MKSRKTQLLLSCLLLSFLAQAQQYNFIQYSVADGLPQSQVFSMCEDNRGYLWFGTQGGGLSRFDGLNFENYSTQDGLWSNYILAIHETKQQELLIGTNLGLCIFNGKTFDRIPFQDKEHYAITAIRQDESGKVWLGTGWGIFQWNPGDSLIQKLFLDSTLDKSSIHTFYDDDIDTWIGTDRGAWLLKDQPKRLTIEDGLPNNNIQGFGNGADGLLWVGTYGGGLVGLDPASLEVKQRESIPAIRRIQSLAITNMGEMWIGTPDLGLSIYNRTNGTWRTIREQEGLPNNHVRAILQDRAGNIWVATSGGGVGKYLGQFFVHFDRNEGLKGNQVYALMQDRKDRIWFSTASKGLMVYDSASFSSFERDSGYLDIKCKAILEDRLDRIWVGTEGKGIAIFDTSGMQTITVEDGLPSNWIRELDQDSRGNIWVATYGSGIARIDTWANKSKLELSRRTLNINKYGQQQGLPSMNIASLKIDRRSRVWFGTRNGQVGVIEKYAVQDIFEQQDGVPRASVRAIEFDEFGRIWIGTAGYGIYMAIQKADGVQFEALEFTKKLTSDNIYLLIFDQSGNLWAGHEKGVDQISFNETGGVVDIQHFGKSEGFLGIETCQNAAITDQKGGLWFGTINGLTRHIPTKRVERNMAPSVHFQEISLFYKPLNATEYSNWLLPKGGLKSGLELPHNENHLSFEFKAIDINHPQDIRYRWKLDGSEQDWSPWSPKNYMDYANLLPGNYTFITQASINNAIGEPISASFSIKKPFWQMSWFLWTVIGGGILLIAGFISIRIRQFRKKERAKREKLEMENNLLILEQKALQLQMNPHFIFNALNSIQSLVATKDYMTARQEINNFATLMRSILTNSRKQEITLEEEIQGLAHYLKMEQFCQKVSFTFEICPPKSHDPEEVYIPPMLLQPFVENAIIHGVAHLQQEGHIQIKFSIGEELLACAIQDNGVGRMRSAQLRLARSPKHKSTATAVTKERLEALKEGRQYQALEILDIMENDRVQGTRVIIRLPLETNF